MEDRDIVTLYWQRDQEAIRQTDRLFYLLEGIY